MGPQDDFCKFRGCKNHPWVWQFPRTQNSLKVVLMITADDRKGYRLKSAQGESRHKASEGASHCPLPGESQTLVIVPSSDLWQCAQNTSHRVGSTPKPPECLLGTNRHGWLLRGWPLSPAPLEVVGPKALTVNPMIRPSREAWGPLTSSTFWGHKRTPPGSQGQRPDLFGRGYPLIHSTAQATWCDLQGSRGWGAL